MKSFDITFSSTKQHLINLFSELIDSQVGNLGFFEGIIKQMSSEAKFDLVLKFTQWLSLQSDEFNNIICKHNTDTRISTLFQQSLDAWVNNINIDSNARRESLDNTSTRNAIFQDYSFNIALADIDNVKNILVNSFSELVEARLAYIGFFEGMFKELSSEAKFALFIKFIRWMSVQSPEFGPNLIKLSEEGHLDKVLQNSFNKLSQDISFEIAGQESRIRNVYANELFPNLREISVPVGVIHEESGHANHADMVYVCGIAAAVKANKIFEIGTYRGQTTVGLASVCKNAQVFTLNHPPQEDLRYAPFIGMYIKKYSERVQSFGWWKVGRRSNRIEQIFCDSTKFDTTQYRESMDYIFIDGDHSYSGVKNDTRISLEMLKPGGVIVWHDYAWKSPGVVKFISEFSQTRPVFRLHNTCLIVYIDGCDPEKVILQDMDESLERAEGQAP